MNLSIFVFLILFFGLTLAFADSEDDIDLLESKVVKAFLAGEYEEAISYYDQILEIDPNNIDGLNNKGVALTKLGKPEEAISYFDQVLEINPNNAPALDNKGIALAQLDKLEEALLYFDQVLEIDPNNVHGLNNKGTTLNSLEQYFEAWKYFGKVLDIMPDNSIAINGLSYAKARMYKPIDAKLEVTVRNSQGNLIAYLTTTDIIVLDHDFTKKHMDTWWIIKEIVARDGQDFEILQFSADIDVTSDDRKFYSVSYAEDIAEQVHIIRGKINGVPLDEGDLVNLFWTVFRPIE